MNTNVSVMYFATPIPLTWTGRKCLHLCCAWKTHFKSWKKRWMISGGNEVWPVLKLDRFLQPGWLHKVRGHDQCHSLNGRPVHQFCQRRDHTLFFRPASNLGDSQQRTRRVMPGMNIQLTWPCGSRQISGCFHFCQSSSVCSASTSKS